MQAQTMKKFVLVEHFTNTRCPLCVSGNKTIYDAINNYPDNVHHIAIHPSVPYTNCELFQYNTLDNGAREAYYNINFTPQSFVDGEFVNNRSLAQGLETVILEKAGLQLIVEESEGTNRTINVTVVLKFANLPPRHVKCAQISRRNTSPCKRPEW